LRSASGLVGLAAILVYGGCDGPGEETKTHARCGS
jgi:hypothetical protein